MAIYMQASRRRHRITAITAFIAPLVGGAIGYAIGHSNSTSSDDIIATAQTRGQDAATALARLPIEYEQAVANATGESMATIDEALDDAEAVLHTVFAAAPWLGARLRQQPLDAIDVLRHDTETHADLQDFQSHVIAATASINELFGLPT